MLLEVETVVEAQGWSAGFDPEALARSSVTAAAAGRIDADARPAECCVIFTDDAQMRALNQAWRQIDKPTNVLSFPASGLPADVPVAMLGDIFLGLETVQREAVEQQKTLRDHTAHLIVHGFLHLIGYDHIDDADAGRMEGEEIVILAGLGIGNPYEGDWRPEDAG